MATAHLTRTSTVTAASVAARSLRRYCIGSQGRDTAAAAAAASATSSRRERIVLSPVPDLPASAALNVGSYPRLVLSRADLASNRPALIDATDDGAGRQRVLSFADVRDLSLNAAAGLARRGHIDGSVLALFVHNCPEFFLTQFAGMIAGAAITLVNPNFTVGELAYQLRNSGATTIVTQADKFEVAAKAAKEAGCVKDIYVVGKPVDGARSFADLLADPGRNPFSLAENPTQSEPAAESRVAILPYSSGTTGLPKGVRLSHANICYNLLQYKHSVQPPVLAGPYLGLMPFYHIYGQAMGGQALYNGCPIVVLRKFEPETFLRAVEEHGISVMHIVPPLVLFLLQHQLVDSFNLASVRQVFSAAAPLGHDSQLRLAEMFRNRFGTEIDIQQLYGLTETSPITHAPQPIGQRPADIMGKIGAPVCNQLTRVVSVTTGEDLGPNEEGEILVKGPQVMLGYHNNEKATNECIRDGWFHTGDIGVYDENNYFKVVDRLKELIKVKGSQVAPAELEELILGHPSVLDCAVIGRPDERAGELPCAFVVPKTGAHLAAEEVTRFVAERVAGHKRLDGGVVFVEAIPRNPSGKILRRLLRDSLRS